MSGPSEGQDQTDHPLGQGGHAGSNHVRDLSASCGRESAEIGVLLTMQEPTQPMRTEAAGAGFYTSLGWQEDYPRVPFPTIADLLSGKRVDSRRARA